MLTLIFSLFLVMLTVIVPPLFASNIKSYNESVSNEEYSLPEINGLDTRNYTEESDKQLKGTAIYQLEAGGKCNVIETKVEEFLKNSKIIYGFSLL